MANTKNLKRGNPATQFENGREAAESGKKGGKASGEARRRTASIKKYLQAALDGKYNDNGETLTGSELLVKNLLSIAFCKSDKDQLAAIKYVFSLLGEDRTEEEIEKIKSETKLIKAKIKAVESEQWTPCSTIGGGYEGTNE